MTREREREREIYISRSTERAKEREREGELPRPMYELADFGDPWEYWSVHASQDRSKAPPVPMVQLRVDEGPLKVPLPSQHMVCIVYIYMYIYIYTYRIDGQ